MDRSQAPNLALWLAGEPADGAPLALGRTPGTGHPHRRFPRFHRSLGRRRGEVLVERPPCRGVAAALGERHNLEDPHGAVERDRDDVTRLHSVARSRNARPVHPHVPGAGERGGGRARSHRARVPQPLIYALAIQRRGLS